MNKNNPLIYVPLRYGLFGAVINIMAILALFYFGRHPLLLNPLLDARLPLYIIFIFFSMRTYRDEFNGGILHFWQGMTIGVINYMSMAIIVALFIQIFAGIEASNFLNDYIRMASEQIEANRAILADTIGESTVEKTLLELPSTTALHLAADYLLKSMPLGLFLTTIFAILLRRK
jgi:hypothetical protein